MGIAKEKSIQIICRCGTVVDSTLLKKLEKKGLTKVQQRQPLEPKKTSAGSDAFMELAVTTSAGDGLVEYTELCIQASREAFKTQRVLCEYVVETFVKAKKASLLIRVGNLTEKALVELVKKYSNASVSVQHEAVNRQTTQVFTKDKAGRFDGDYFYFEQPADLPVVLPEGFAEKIDNLFDLNFSDPRAVFPIALKLVVSQFAQQLESKSQSEKVISTQEVPNLHGNSDYYLMLEEEDAEGTTKLLCDLLKKHFPESPITRTKTATGCDCVRISGPEQRKGRL